jgi:hypothetical protein
MLTLAEFVRKFMFGISEARSSSHIIHCKPDRRSAAKAAQLIKSQYVQHQNKAQNYLDVRVLCFSGLILVVTNWKSLS